MKMGDWVRIETDDYDPPVPEGSEGRTTTVDLATKTIGVMIKCRPGKTGEPACVNIDYLLDVVEMDHVCLNTHCPPR